MSLVDYASSSDEEEIEEEREDKVEEGEGEGEGEEKNRDGPSALPSLPLPAPRPPLRPPSLHSRNVIAPSRQQSDAISTSSSSMEKLPDASLLFSSPSFSSNQLTGSDHSSRVAAAVAESASRKREANGSAFSYSRRKLPRGNLPHSRNVPDTMGGMLIPPQLNGRSNVATEDMSNLFVRRRHAESSN